MTPANNQRIEELASQLRAASSGTVEVSGYTDNLGTHQHGVELSHARAEAAIAALGKLPGKKVVVKAMAEANPVASNATADGRAKNRRVEIRFHSS